MAIELIPTNIPGTPGQPRYPEVHIPIAVKDRTAFQILTTCRLAARRAGVPPGEVDRFIRIAAGKSYDSTLLTAMRWFDVS